MGIGGDLKQAQQDRAIEQAAAAAEQEIERAVREKYAYARKEIARRGQAEKDAARREMERAAEREECAKQPADDPRAGMVNVRVSTAVGEWALIDAQAAQMVRLRAERDEWKARYIAVGEAHAQACKEREQALYECETLRAGNFALDKERCRLIQEAVDRRAELDRVQNISLLRMDKLARIQKEVSGVF